MMHRGICAKFQQNLDILEKLIDTDNAILAECSPCEKIWGICLAVDDVRIHYVTKWKGKNLLELKITNKRVGHIIYVFLRMMCPIFFYF